ncbi:UBN2_3 domain-containing protein [Senna tora]|uniref:UBN2_3 domain-containing protein n=1 Tax=Senna tora TaxID=362788 RepID=A0A834XC73_9FABA|nr:UBN2_3 domain-containing protein [Senna tora]
MADERTSTPAISKEREGTYRLHNSNHPHMALVNTTLDGKNFFAWSIAMRTALEAKDKVGFIDGSVPEPEEASERRKWKMVDSMVKTWITNSLSKEIADTFVYCVSAKALWDVLAQRYGTRNAPHVYQIQRHTSSVRQGADSVTLYYNKLHRCWDEMDRVMPTPACTCAKYEAQREIGLTYSSAVETPSLMMAKAQQGKNDGNYKKRDPSKKDKVCEHCNGNGHTKDTCFKIHGYPEWWKEFKEKKAAANGKKAVSNMATEKIIQETPITQEFDGKGDLTSVVNYLLKEVQRLGKGKLSTSKDEQVHFAYLHEFVGNLKDYKNLKSLNSCWIIDTGATSHMCCNKMLMHDCNPLVTPKTVHLPDKTTKLIHSIGKVTLQNNLVLNNVFFMPTFGYNLLSVHKLIKDTNVYVTFFPSHCLIQDQRSSRILAKGAAIGSLYYLDESCLSFPTSFVKTDTICCNNAKALNMKHNDSFDVWHMRLGHPSIKVMQQINDIAFIPDATACDICHAAKQPRLAFGHSNRYVAGQKAYKLYDLDNKRTLIFRDVVFYETQFPFLNTPTESNLPLPLIPVTANTMETGFNDPFSHPNAATPTDTPTASLDQTSNSPAHLAPTPMTPNLGTRDAEPIPTLPVNPMDNDPVPLRTSTWLQDYVCFSKHNENEREREGMKESSSSGSGGKRSESEKEKTKMRERHRRAITTNIFHGLRKHGGYRLSPRADINEVLRELAKEAGWVVEPDGTTYRSSSKSRTGDSPCLLVVAAGCTHFGDSYLVGIPICCTLCGAPQTSSAAAAGDGGADCSTTAAGDPLSNTNVGSCSLLCFRTVSVPVYTYQELAGDTHSGDGGRSGIQGGFTTMTCQQEGEEEEVHLEGVSMSNQKTMMGMGSSSSVHRH